MFKYILASIAVLSAGVDFAFKFLLEARDYPELSLVMLAVVVFVIGTICLFAALAVCGALISASTDAFQAKRSDTDSTAEMDIDTTETEVTSLTAKVLFIITVIFGLGAAFVLLPIGFAAFHYTAGDLGESLGVLQSYLGAKIS